MAARVVSVLYSDRRRDYELVRYSKEALGVVIRLRLRCCPQGSVASHDLYASGRSLIPLQMNPFQAFVRDLL